MRRFKKILVAVDLAKGDRFVSTELPVPSAEAVKRAIWLAKNNSAHVSFFHAVDVSTATQRMLEESDEGKSILAEAETVLQQAAALAAGDGVTSDIEICLGKSWLEIIRRVLQANYDLVVAGTRHQGAFQSYLMGSTGIKLLRKCPCPVWITQPQSDSRINSILVAHDLRPVGDLAMALGCSMAQLHGADLHVLHSLEFPGMNYALPAGGSLEKAAHYRSDAEQRISTQLENYKFAQPPQVHIVTERPDFAVLEHVDRHAIELLVMGTIARTGIAGFIVGNTAERLLPQIPCSVLAVKPKGFVSPVPQL